MPALANFIKPEAQITKAKTYLHEPRNWLGLVLLQIRIRFREMPAPEETVVCRERRGVRCLNDEVLCSVNELLLCARISPPQHDSKGGSKGGSMGGRNDYTRKALKEAAVKGNRAKMRPLADVLEAMILSALKLALKDSWGLTRSGEVW